MARIHERLYETEDLSEIEGGEFLRDLSAGVLSSYGADPTRILLVVDVAPNVVSVETAIPCGLIVHELVANCLQHAFPGDDGGTIWVEAKLVDDCVHLSVRDDGVGLPADFDVEGSLGLRIVADLTRKLQGVLSRSSDDGARFEVRFRPYG
jgi:two-component sensor histidine kinase